MRACSCNVDGGPSLRNVAPRADAIDGGSNSIVAEILDVVVSTDGSPEMSNGLSPVSRVPVNEVVAADTVLIARVSRRGKLIRDNQFRSTNFCFLGSSCGSPSRYNR
jgi:hypothetical protein